MADQQTIQQTTSFNASLMLLVNTRLTLQQSMVCSRLAVRSLELSLLFKRRRRLQKRSLYGTTKILSVHGSFTLVPDAYPLTSTYLPLLSNGLNTYPGFSGTAFAVGNPV